MDTSFLEIGKSYEQFLINSKMINILNTTLLDSTLTNRNKFVDSVATTVSQKNLNDIFVDFSTVSDVEKFASASDNTLRLQLFERYAFNPLLDLFSINNTLPSIDLHVDNVPLPDAYINKMQSLLANIYVFMIHHIESVCENQSSYCSDFSSPGVRVPNEMTLRIQTVTTSLKESLNDDMAPTFEEYLNNVFAYFVGGVFVDLRLTQAELNLLFIVLTPLFMVIYLSHYLPSKNILAGGVSQRNSYVRRKCIINIYKVYLYTLYSIYHKAIVLSPSAAYTLKLQQIIDVFVSEVIQPEMNIYEREFATAIEREMERVKQNTQLSTSIQSDSRSVELLRSQISNILINKKEHDDQLKSSITIKWLWFSLLMTYIVSLIVVFFLMKKIPSLGYMFGIFSIIIISMILIVYLVKLAKNYI